MANNKKPLQQKAVLQCLLQIVVDFRVTNVNIKAVFQYLQTPQVQLQWCTSKALQSTSSDIKKAATAILIECCKQIGPAVIQLVAQFDLPELQLKAIREELSTVQ